MVNHGSALIWKCISYNGYCSVLGGLDILSTRIFQKRHYKHFVTGWWTLYTFYIILFDIVIRI